MDKWACVPWTILLVLWVAASIVLMVPWTVLQLLAGLLRLISWVLALVMQAGWVALIALSPLGPAKEPYRQ
jgi:hypothetical protein